MRKPDTTTQSLLPSRSFLDDDTATIFCHQDTIGVRQTSTYGMHLMMKKILTDDVKDVLREPMRVREMVTQERVTMGLKTKEVKANLAVAKFSAAQVVRGGGGADKGWPRGAKVFGMKAKGGEGGEKWWRRVDGGLRHEEQGGRR